MLPFRVGGVHCCSAPRFSLWRGGNYVGNVESVSGLLKPTPFSHLSLGIQQPTANMCFVLLLFILSFRKYGPWSIGRWQDNRGWLQLFYASLSG